MSVMDWSYNYGFLVGVTGDFYLHHCFGFGRRNCSIGLGFFVGRYHYFPGDRRFRCYLNTHYSVVVRVVFGRPDYLDPALRFVVRPDCRPYFERPPDWILLDPEPDLMLPRSS